jgi:hypothetical protein
LEKAKDMPIYGEFLVDFENILYIANGGSPNTIEAYDLIAEEII